MTNFKQLLVGFIISLLIVIHSSLFMFTVDSLTAKVSLYFPHLMNTNICA